MDRRVKKTRKLVMDTLIQLMAEKDFEKITINEIADLADINRGTIYLHFEDKYDLLNQCVDAALSELEQSCMESMVGNLSPKESITITFKYLEDHALKYKILLNSNGKSAFRTKLTAMMKQSLEAQFLADTNQLIGVEANTLVKNDVLIQFITSAAVGTLEWWFLTDNGYSAEEITVQFLEIMERFNVL